MQSLSLKYAEIYKVSFKSQKLNDRSSCTVLIGKRLKFIVYEKGKRIIHLMRVLVL